MQDAIAALARAGFDIAHAFDVDAVRGERGFERLAGAERCGILVGNTRALWEPFCAALREPALAAEEHPLERYTERVITAACPSARVIFGHRRDRGAFFPMQRLAVATGLGALAPTQLVIHPVYGPWFALRAVVLVDGDAPRRVPIAQPCQCDARCGDAVRTALATSGPDTWRAWLAVRDACALRAFRYSDEQVRYHYSRTWPVGGTPDEGGGRPDRSSS